MKKYGLENNPRTGKDGDFVKNFGQPLIVRVYGI
jgi:hypothetical protein